MADRIAGLRESGGAEGHRPDGEWAAAPAVASTLAVTASLLLAPLLAPIGLSAQDTSPTSSVRVSRVFIGLDGKDAGASGTEVTFVGAPVEHWGLGTTAGFMVSSVGQVLGYMGLHRPVPLPWSLTLRPSAAVGAYARGAGRELGSRLEFRSGASLDLRTKRGMELSLFLYHISNAGLGFRNPGLEAVGVGLSVPLRRPGLDLSARREGICGNTRVDMGRRPPAC